MTSNENPFGELPGALVDDLLAQADGIGERYIAQIEAVRHQREEIRERMAVKGLLQNTAICHWWKSLRLAGLMAPALPNACLPPTSLRLLPSPWKE